MATDEPVSVAESLLGSIKSHVEDRLRSPFAGAFAIAWLFVNWKAILVLALSRLPIEQRVEAVASDHFGAEEVIWLPLGYATIGLIGYYLLSAAFLVVFELYGMGRRAIERKFDQHRWVAPSVYIDLKKKTRSQVQDLTDLASDHLGTIEDLRSQLATLSSEKVELETQVSERLVEASALQAKLNSVSEDLQIKNRMVSDSEGKNRLLEERNSDLELALVDMEEAAEKLLSPLRVERAKTHMNALQAMLTDNEKSVFIRNQAEILSGDSSAVERLEQVLERAKKIRDPF